MNNIPHIVDTGASVMNEPVAYLMVERNDGNSYIQMGVPTRDEKISHQPYPLYTHPVKELDEQFEKGFKAGKEEGWKAHKFHYPVKELTDEEILDIWYEMKDSSNDWTRYVEFARAILRKAQE